MWERSWGSLMLPRSFGGSLARAFGEIFEAPFEKKKDLLKCAGRLLANRCR